MTLRLLPLCAFLASLVHKSSSTSVDYSASFLSAINSNRYAISVGASSTASGQPCAKNLGNLTWDAALASTAQAWAEKCQYKENPDRDSDYQNAGGNTTVSESIWYDSTQSGSYIDSVAAWWIQNQNFTYGTGTPDNMTYTGVCSSNCGEYKKMVNANATSVGCGVHTCATLSPPVAGDPVKGTNVQFVVCNYSPRYQVIMPPYSTGTTGSCRKTPTPAPTPPPTPVTPTPTPPGTSYFVQSQVKLAGVSKQQFDLSTIQDSFKTTVAQNAGAKYSKTDVTIVSYANARRASALQVTSKLATASQAEANAATATLTDFLSNSTAFTSALKANGMASVTSTVVLQAPTVGETSSSSSSSGLSTGGLIGIVVGVVVAVAIVVVAVVVVIKSKDKKHETMNQASVIKTNVNPMHTEEDSGMVGTVSTTHKSDVHGQI